MDHSYVINELSKNREVYKAMLSGISEEEYLWRSEPEKWNLLEIVSHLYDEEREDFRARVMHILENKEGVAPPIDPEGWVKSRNYRSNDYNEILNKFLDERARSVKLLRSMKSPQWSNAYQHPEYGPLKAEMFLTNWLAHDYLHFRQIVRLKYLYLKETTKQDLRYAGEW